MRLSFDWLLDFVDVSDLTPQEVADKLSMGAFEVEEVRKVGPDLQGPIQVGEILEINPHPNADKIRLTKVRIATDTEPLEIVCGASNIIVGQRVPVALPGARVINRHDGTELLIKVSKIRDIQSNGMLCSPPELGIADGESEGILILPGTAALGTDVIKLLQLYPDYILHVGTRSNRGDALCVRGLAREVAALYGRPIREPEWRLPEVDQTSDAIDIRIESNEDCPFFSLRVLQGLTVAPSPLRITRRLESVGIRPVNNVVDVTNYVLHELGQPLHAYDLSKFETRQMDIRRAKPGELLSTIDGRERELNEEMLIIAEGLRPLGVAGVMGGKDSEIGEGTNFVALEAAAFHPSRVRRASRLLGLTSESSLRFERGVDVAAVRRASDRAAAIILESGGGFLGRITSAGSDQVRPLVVELRLPQLKRLTEIDLKTGEVAELLKRLDFETKIASVDCLEVSVPSFRQRDVTREIDVIEEVCRLWGYDRVPPSMPSSTIAPDTRDSTETVAREALAACGLNETYISSLTGADPIGLGVGAEQDKSIVRVLNPLSEDHQILRSSLLPGLVRAVAYNQDRGAKDVWLYEVGRVYERIGTGSDKHTGVAEELRAGGVMAGRQTLSVWQDKSSTAEATAGAEPADNFYAAKGVVENLLSRLSIDLKKVRFREVEKYPEHFHPGRSCVIEFSGNGPEAQAIGWLGDVHPAVSDKLGLRSSVDLFELSLDALRAIRSEPRYTEIYATPSAVRDLTADFNQSIDHRTVYDCIISAAVPNLRALELISVFRLTDTLQSLSYRLTFQHREQTLTNEEVEQQLASARDKLMTELSAAFRT